MSKVYRLYTEDKNRSKILKTVSEKFDSFTVYETKGYWKGIEEKSIVIEIITDDVLARFNLSRVASEIKLFNKQDCILITESELTHKMVI